MESLSKRHHRRMLFMMMKNIMKKIWMVDSLYTMKKQHQLFCIRLTLNRFLQKINGLQSQDTKLII